MALNLDGYSRAEQQINAHFKGPPWDTHSVAKLAEPVRNELLEVRGREAFKDRGIGRDHRIARCLRQPREPLGTGRRPGAGSRARAAGLRAGAMTRR
jgi:hypothetical protein